MSSRFAGSAALAGVMLRILSPIPLARPARACDCATALSACKEAGASQLVFIGTVESIEPVSLNRWSLTNRSSLSLLNDAFADAQQHPSATALARLKDTYLKAFPGLGADDKHRLEGAATAPDIASLFSTALDRGTRVRFKVKTMFKHEEEDDDSSQAAKSGDREKKDAETLEVWTPFGDCGFDFQAGETYLVYANSDEGSDYFFTGTCTRTRRLSDAGEDLTYLFLYKERPQESARLEGFSTTDGLGVQDFDQLHDPETIESPVADIIVELHSDRLTRYAQSNAHGRFLFDGLPAGDYQVSAFARGYPSNMQLLSGPHPLHIAEKSCSRQILLLPKSSSN